MCDTHSVLDVTRLLARERKAFAAHRDAIRSRTAVPLPADTMPGTFAHGLMLPFTLVRASLRDPAVRGPYLRLLRWRALSVACIAALVLASGGSPKASKGDVGVVHRRAAHDGDGGARAEASASKRSEGTDARQEPDARPDAKRPDPVHVHLPGLHIDLDEDKGEKRIRILGRDIPVDESETARDGAEATTATAPPSTPKAESDEPLSFFGAALAPLADRVGAAWASLLAFIGFLSGVELVVVALSRRYDDWLSFHASRLAAIRPEDGEAKAPAIALDFAWMKRKVSRRFRGFVVFAAGVPVLFLLRLLPFVGGPLFSLALVVWGWYWLGVFSAAKSAHAWADAARAPSPAPIRATERTVPTWVAPVRWYTKFWAKLTRSLNPPASAFERAPASFLGLALARAVLALPGLYLLARPLVPVAAGRLCAESDPERRFFDDVTPSAPPPDVTEHAPPAPVPPVRLAG